MLHENERTFNDIADRYYFEPIRSNFEEKVNEVGIEAALSCLTEIMRSSERAVGDLIRNRIQQGEIADFSQASKAVAGNGFQGLVAYALIYLQRHGAISDQLVITLKPKRHPLIERYASIQVGDDVQKPDVDLMIYHKTELANKPVLIFSMKTSLRERVGQTYKWKLLMDIASSSDCMEVKSKYGLSFQMIADFRVGLITTNFYNEITQPQQIGMLNFFDYVYLTKSGEFQSPIMPFSQIITDLREVY